MVQDMHDVNLHLIKVMTERLKNQITMITCISPRGKIFYHLVNVHVYPKKYAYMTQTTAWSKQQPIPTSSNILLKNQGSCKKSVISKHQSKTM